MEKLSQHDSQLQQTIQNLQIENQDLHEIIEQQQGMIFKYTERDGEFIHTFATGKLLYKIGLSKESLVGKTVKDVLPMAEAVKKSYYYRRAWDGEENISYEGKLNGVHYLASLRPIWKDGQVREVIASCVDISERVESESRFQKIAQRSLSGVVIYNDEEIFYANPAACQIVREELVGKSVHQFVLAELAEFPMQLERAIQFERNAETLERRLRLTDGSIIEIKVAISPIYYEGKSAILAIFNDETRRRNAERTFEVAAKELSDVNYALNESSIVAITNRRGIIQFVNTKFCEISQYDQKELLGKTHSILNSGHHPREFFQNMWRTIGTGKTWRGEIRNRTKSGTYYWVDTTIVPFLNETGKPYQYVSIRTDITERKKVEEALRLSEEKLKHMAYHDFLTGLPNRRYFVEKLKAAVQDAAMYHKKLAVIYMDMDRFKAINDTFGHDEGDAVLKEFARVVGECLPNDAVFARQGGDEFTSFISNIVDEQVVLQLVDHISEAITQSIRGHKEISASIGVAFYPEDGLTEDELMKRADQALYVMKENK